MSEENKALAREFLRMMELGEPNMADEILAADFYSHAAPDPSASIEGVKATATMMKNAFSGAQAKIAFQVAEGDKVVTRYEWSGTHHGELFGIPATGKQLNWTITTTFRIADGKIHEVWLNWDQWGLMQQLGVVPVPEG
jgi:steroid delta-isomerase-like uncharacterized protein